MPKSARARGVAFVLWLGFVALRAPRLFLAPRFWAEEGRDYFGEALHGGFGTLFHLHHGFVGFVQRVAAWFATLVPLELAPGVTTAVGFLAQASPAAIWLTSIEARRASWPRSLAVLLLVAVTVPSHELYATTTCLHFHLAAAALVCLVTSTGSRPASLLRIGVLLAGGLSGPPACFLAPLFVVRAWQERALRDSGARPEAIALLAATLVQATGVLFGQRTPSQFEWSGFFAAVGFKSVLLPLLGKHEAESLARLLGAHTALIGAGLVAFLALLFVRWREPVARRLVLAFALLTSFGYLGALSIGKAEPIARFAEFSGRYFFAPNLALGMLLLTAASATSARVPCKVVLAIVLILATHEHLIAGRSRAYFFTGPAWRAEVQRWRDGATSELRIWPTPWFVRIPQN